MTSTIDDQPAEAGHGDGAARTDGPPEDAPADSPDAQPPHLGGPSLGAALEALLLVAEEPVQPLTLAEFLQVPQGQVEDRLERLAQEYLEQSRGFELRGTDAGWRFYTSEQCRDLMTRFVTDGRQGKLSQAALETLAIVAYRQPVTRSQVGAVRGVNPDGVIKTLASRGLIAEVGGEGAVAHFVTTAYFLDRMGLASLAELPPIADHLPGLDSLDDLVD
jgi:segregation and condensation protein B